ncbi:MAG: oligoendopeptidase F [Lachnospiraceae bacterium]|nr:oligoendopeptidase F [Lachnospiraceae bacterium]
MKRQEQQVENTWRLEDIYENEDLFSQDAERLDARMDQFAGLQGTLKDGSEALLKVMQLYEEMNQIFEKLYVYANQRNHEDTANAKYQKMSGEMNIVAARLSQVTAWLESEILELDEAVLRQEMELEPELKKYDWFLIQITRKKAHILDKEKEALMARVGELAQTPSNVFAMFNNADITFPEITDEKGEKRKLTVGTFISCMESKDRILRQHAFQALYGEYKQYINTLSAAYYGNAKQADFFAKERHYANAMEEALDGSNIPVSVYQNLIETMKKRLPTMYRYVALRKKLLGYEELHMYDVYVPMVDTPEKKYSFEEAKEMVKRALAPLGEDYQALLQKGFDNRWIDVYENEGKRTGAYSWGAYGTHPYVLLNYHGSLNDVFTLAHEMGHALHSWHSDHKQPYLYAGYKIFVAEVASTCNEALLISDLLKRTNDQTERKYLINYFLDQFKGTMYRQTMFAEFEMLTHDIVSQGGVLTAEQLCELYLTLNKKYFGEEMISDPEIAYEWARIPHFYTPFYVYQYATGFAASIAISSKILKGEEGIVEKYKQFLSGGSSMDPIDLLKLCDVDMSTPQPVEEALDVFESYLSELEKSI